MPVGRAASAAMVAVWLAGEGCTALREIPRGEYAAAPERRNARLVTREGLRYELDFVRVEGDTLVGFRRRELEGPIDEYATVRVPLDEVESFSTRSVDWRRTTLLGGGAVAVLAVVALKKALGDRGQDSSGGAPGGGKGIP